MKNFEPLESPRAVEIPDIRATVNAVLKRAKEGPLLTPKQIALAKDRVEEYDRLSAVLQGDPYRDGNDAYLRQQAEIGAGKIPKDTYELNELRQEARTIIHASRTRCVGITSEIAEIIRPANELFLQSLNKVVLDVEEKERAVASEFGIGYYQPSLTIGVLKDIERRFEKLIPPPGAMKSVRIMLQPFMDVDPIPVESAYDAHTKKKLGLIEKTKKALQHALAEEPALQQARIDAANAEKEERKRQLAAAGVIKLGSAEK